jgi:hypothetical protein
MFAGKSIVMLCGMTSNVGVELGETGAFETSSDGVRQAAKGKCIDTTSDGVTLSVRSCQCDVMLVLDTLRGTSTMEKSSEFADDSDGFNAMSTGGMGRCLF